MKKDVQDPEKDIFYKNFIGQEVDFIVSMYFQQDEHNGETMISQKSPLSIRGYVLDVDEKYVYMGMTPDSITKFISKDVIVGGDIVDEEDEFDGILNNFSSSGKAN